MPPTAPAAKPAASRGLAAMGLVAAVLFWAAAALTFAKAGRFTPHGGYLLAVGAFWALITRRGRRGAAER